MFVSHHTLKWTRTCRSHGRHPHAHTAHFLLNRHTSKPGAPDGAGDAGGKTPPATRPAVSPNAADDGKTTGTSPLASTGAGTGPAVAVAGLLAMAGASLLAAVARTRRRDAGQDGTTAD